MLLLPHGLLMTQVNCAVLSLRTQRRVNTDSIGYLDEPASLLRLRLPGGSTTQDWNKSYSPYPRDIILGYCASMSSQRRVNVRSRGAALYRAAPHSFGSAPRGRCDHRDHVAQTSSVGCGSRVRCVCDGTWIPIMHPDVLAVALVS